MTTRLPQGEFTIERMCASPPRLSLTIVSHDRSGVHLHGASEGDFRNDQPKYRISQQHYPVQRENRIDEVKHQPDSDLFQ
jgi:hypothetical protein